ncbi:MAG: heparan-alpha-glucosaminide N-acetyltransferase domain-containing protein [Vicinamibacterales bacterium]
MITSTPSRRPRLESIDVLRGVVMIIMALDHTRDYLGASVGDPTNLATTTTALFFTRWITHFCAPVFFLLTGTGARLSLARKGRAGLSRYLLTRGLWLVILEPIVVRCLVYQFNVDFHVTLLLILWALGWSMVLLSALIWLPTWVIAAFGLIMIAGHNALDAVRSPSPFWLILHGRGVLVSVTDHVVLVIYPLIPWVGVTAVGYALGAVYTWEPERRRAWLLRAGLAVVAGFLVIRGLNVYGDPFPWKTQASSLFTVWSFINTTKYPASLLFLMMTLGPALLFLRALDRRTPDLLRPALTLGKVPLFYYLGHFALIHAIAGVVCLVRYGSMWYVFESPDLAHFPFSAPPGWGFSVPVVWLWWLAVVLMMYVPSRWFAGVKARRTEWWWGYL